MVWATSSRVHPIQSSVHRCGCTLIMRVGGRRLSRNAAATWAASAVALASVIYRLANADMLLPRKRVQ